MKIIKLAIVMVATGLVFVQCTKENDTISGSNDAATSSKISESTATIPLGQQVAATTTFATYMAHQRVFTDNMVTAYLANTTELDRQNHLDALEAFATASSLTPAQEATRATMLGFSDLASYQSWETVNETNSTALYNDPVFGGYNDEEKIGGIQDAIGTGVPGGGIGGPYNPPVDPLCAGYANCIGAAVDTWEAARARCNIMWVADFFEVGPFGGSSARRKQCKADAEVAYYEDAQACDDAYPNCP